ncbi:DUF945 family protein [Leucothrix sargassi]|nr:DUF945 family protein [Leucothrix sargassi]
MKKLLIAIPLIAIAGGAAAPYVIGSKIETAAKQQVELSNQQLEKALAANPQLSKANIELDSYEKGYLGATAEGKVNFTINLGLGESKAITIPFTSEIKHGPYLGDAGFGASSIVTRPDFSGFEELPDAIDENTVVINTLVGFSGDVTDKAVIAPIVFEEDGTKFDFAGATINSVAPNASNRATFTSDATFEAFTITSTESTDGFTLKPFTLDIESDGESDFSKGTYTAVSSAIEGVIGDNEGSFSLQKLDLKGGYEQAKGTDIIPLTNAQIDVENIVFENQGLPSPIKLPKLSMMSVVEQPDGTDFDITAKYAFELDPSVLQLMNSPIDVKTADILVKLNDFPIDVIEAYQAIVEEMVATGQADQMPEAIEEKVLSIVQSLVKSASSANIEVNAKATEGDLAADLDVGFKPGLELSETELMGLLGAPDPARLLAILVGRGDVSLGKGVTDKLGVTPMIQMMAADFVNFDGDTLKSDVKITDNQLLINGKPLPMMGGM